MEMERAQIRKTDAFVHWSGLFDFFEEGKDGTLGSEMYHQGNYKVFWDRALRLLGYPEQMDRGRGWEIGLPKELRGWPKLRPESPADIIINAECN